MAGLTLTIYTELNKYNAQVTDDDNKIIITDSSGTQKKEDGKDVDYLTLVSGNTEAYIQKKSTYWQKAKESAEDWTNVTTAEKILFKFTMQTVHLEKKMYQPNELVVEILVNAKSTSEYLRKAFLTRKDFMLFFAKKKVKLASGDNVIFDDYYVHDIIPAQYPDKTVLQLKIYSPDKVMTLQKYCRAFCSKKLGTDIMSSQCGQFSLPYDPETKVGYYMDGMMNLLTKERTSTTENNKKKIKVTTKGEHIFPYLVQYNESFYDFLARTTNRWGEFLYYEDNKLNLGYEPKEYEEGNAVAISSYDKITYRDYSAGHPSQTGAGSYLSEAPYDDNILNSVYEKDEYETVKGTIANITDMDKGGDAYLMSKVNQLLTNGLPLSKFLVNTAIADLVDLKQKELYASDNNKKVNDDYLTPSKKYIPTGIEHYDDESNKTKYNEFTELDTSYTAGKYITILDSEVRASKNIIDIECGTTYPNLKLGQIISVNDKTYIVVEITAYNPEVFRTEDNNYWVKGVDDGKILFRVSAIAADNSQYFPAPLDKGHICKSGPQVAVVVDVEDPCRMNRVRVMYPWQLEPMIAAINQEFIDKQAEIDKDTKLSDDEKTKQKAELEAKKIKKYEDLDASRFKDQSKFNIENASPWLFYASASGPKGAGVHGRHYLAEKVLINYAHENIERPFVVGAVSKDIPLFLKTSSAVIQAPNYEYIKVHEGLGNGVATFLANMSPAGKLITGFAPITLTSDWKNSNYFEGGIDMGDRYGIWSIKGSTHDRKISISSPWGDVNISAFTGITISAPNGDIKIQGKNVTIEAGNNLKLVSGTNIKNKFLNVGEGSLKDVVINASLTITKAVAQKLEEMLLSAIDFTFLRHVVEVFFRPLEGTLQISSNRFLMLGAAGCVPGLPDTAYKNPEKKGYEKFEKSDTYKMGPAIAHIIGKFPAFVEAVINDYIDNYKDCVNAKEKYESHVQNLVTFAKDYNPAGAAVQVCASYRELSKKLWDSNKKTITDSDLAFVQAQVNDADKGAGMDNVISRHYLKGRLRIHKEQYINWRRKVWKKQLVEDANNLRKCITKLKAASMFTYQVDFRVGYWYGFGKRNMPADYVTSIKKAFSADNCKLSTIYQTIANVDGNGHQVAITEANVGNPQYALTTDALTTLCNNTLNDAGKRKALARMAAVGLLEQWGIKEVAAVQGGAAIQNLTLKGLLGNEEAYISDNAWQDMTRHLTVESLSPIGKDTNFLTNTLNSALDKAKFWKNAKDCFAWGDAKKGQILFSSGTPHVLDNGIGDIDTSLSSGKLNRNDMLDRDKQQLDKFASIIREKLQGLGVVVGNGNMQQALLPGQVGGGVEQPGGGAQQPPQAVLPPQNVHVQNAVGQQPVLNPVAAVPVQVPNQAQELNNQAVPQIAQPGDVDQNNGQEQQQEGGDEQPQNEIPNQDVNEEVVEEENVPQPGN